jgi:hypothetical protein
MATLEKPGESTGNQGGIYQAVGPNCATAGHP